MRRDKNADRRDFLKLLGAASLASGTEAESTAVIGAEPAQTSKIQPGSDITYPRTFTGPALKMISFPLGGIGAGSIGVGGRGQLRDWEIFNRPDQGNAPQYAFPSIWVEKPAPSARRTCSKPASKSPT